MQTRIPGELALCLGRCSFFAAFFILLFDAQGFDTTAEGMSSASAPTSEPAEISEPMAAFARLEAGEWRLGTFHTTSWQWGPGHHSIRAHRVGSDVDGNPWRELVIYYLHPDRKQIHLLSFHPDIPGVGRGVGEGTIEFDDDTATTSLVLHQAGTRRNLEASWTFEGPDMYRDVLFEDSGRGLTALAEWVYTRSMERSPPPTPAADQEPTASRNIRAFVPLLGQWESRTDRRANPVHSRFEWMEYLDVVAVNIGEVSEDGKHEPLFNAYFYHHVGYNELRCVAISASGSIYEGCVAVLEDNNLEFDLAQFEDDAGDRRLVHVEFAPDGALRTRAWSIDGDDHTLVLDAIHRRRPESKKD